MIITFTSIVAALVIAYYDFNTPLHFSSSEVAAFIVLAGTTILALSFLFNVIITIPIGRMAQKLAPNLTVLFLKDKPLVFQQTYLFLFSFFSFLIATGLLVSETPYPSRILLVWFVFFGLSLDFLKDRWTRSLKFLNPFFIVNEFTHQAKKAIINGNDDELWGALDNLSDLTLRAVEKSQISLSTQALQCFPQIMHTFFASSKSISRINVDAKIEKETGRDEVSYALFFLIQRLELINDKALQSRLETALRQIIMNLGKMIVYAAKLDLSLVAFPTHFLTKFGLKAQQHHFAEVSVLTTSTLSEISKTILTDIDVTYLELQEPFYAIINGLDAIAKATFKKDKQSSLKVLIQPLVEMKELFFSEKLAKHRDTPVILHEIDRIITEFETLDQVMRTIPPINLSKEP